MIESVVFWNEPNNLSHWDRELDPDWSRFAEMICLAGERVKRVAPGLTRVLGGISPLDPWFVNTLFSRGCGDAVDVVAVHGFPLDWNRWHVQEWGQRLAAVREAAGGKPLWATEVGVSSLASETLQAWAVDATMESLLPHVERIYWYSLMDLPEKWQAVTRHAGSEGSAYFRHFRMGVCGADGRPKPAAEKLAHWAQTADVGVCEWVYWWERDRLDLMVERLQALGIRHVRTGLGWADWERHWAQEWFDLVMERLAPFEVTLTLCFTPAHRGVRPHHTSPPREVEAYAEFCETVARRYALRQGPILTSRLAGAAV